MQNTNQRAVAAKTRVNAGALTNNHSEAVAVKMRVNAGGFPSLTPIRILAALTLASLTLAGLSAQPLAAQRAVIGGESITVDVAPGYVDTFNYVPGVVAGAAFPSGLLFVAGVSGVTGNTVVNLAVIGNFTPATGAPALTCALTAPVKGPGSGNGQCIVDSSNAKPGVYQFTLQATDTATQVMGTSPPHNILVATAAGSLQTMGSTEHMTVSLNGTQILVKAMGVGEAGGAAAHFRMIFHNLGASKLQVASGPGIFFLAPGDVIAADFSTSFDVVVTSIDSNLGTLEVGFP